jgi:hypothetical protein
VCGIYGGVTLWRLGSVRRVPLMCRSLQLLSFTSGGPAPKWEKGFCSGVKLTR